MSGSKLRFRLEGFRLEPRLSLVRLRLATELEKLEPCPSLIMSSDAQCSNVWHSVASVERLDFIERERTLERDRARQAPVLNT